MKPYYEDDAVQIFHGDCREIVGGLEADVVVTDPPYGETSLPWDRWPSGWVAALPESVRQIWCFGSMRMWLAVSGDFAGWRFAQDIVWEKHNGSSFHADRFKRVHEGIVHWYRGEWSALDLTPVMVNEATKATRRRKKRPPHMGGIGPSVHVSEDGGPKLMRSVLYAISCHGYAEHPTQKPEAVVRPLLEYSSAGVVLDPFVGSGTVLRVAKDLGRKAIGIEADERYCEIAAKRMGQEVLDFGGVA